MSKSTSNKVSSFNQWSVIIENALKSCNMTEEGQYCPVHENASCPGVMTITEKEMTDAQMKKREEIVMSMKDKEADFKDRYGDRWKEVMYATATKMAMESKLTEATETFTVMAIGDTNPEYKRGGVSYKPNTKVIDQMHSLEKSDVMHAAKMFRQKHPKATISVENKSGKIVKVFKPGEMIKEAASIEDSEYQTYFRSMLKKHGYDSPAEIPDDKKDEFFNAVDKGYSAQNEAVEENDDLGMMKGQLMSIIDRAAALHDRVSAKPPSNVEAWVQAKVTDADTAITALHDYFKYSDDQNPEFAVEPLAEAEVLVKGEKPLTGVTLPLKKMAATAFASAFMDRPTGATPEAIVNQALAVYFQKNKVPNIVRLRNLGRMLQLVSKMGINWNEELIPPQLAKFVNAAASPTGQPIEEHHNSADDVRAVIKELQLRKKSQLQAEASQSPVAPPKSQTQMSTMQRLTKQQQREKEQLAVRHQQQKMSAQQRDFQEKQRQKKVATTQR